MQREGTHCHTSADRSDDERGRGGATVARDSEEFDEADNVVALLPEDIGLGLELSVDIVQIVSCGLGG